MSKKNKEDLDIFLEGMEKSEPTSVNKEMSEDTNTLPFKEEFSELLQSLSSVITTANKYLNENPNVDRDDLIEEWTDLMFNETEHIKVSPVKGSPEPLDGLIRLKDFVQMITHAADILT